MKKLFSILALTLLFSCKKEPVTPFASIGFMCYKGDRYVVDITINKNITPPLFVSYVVGADTIYKAEFVFAMTAGEKFTPALFTYEAGPDGRIVLENGLQVVKKKATGVLCAKD